VCSSTCCPQWTLVDAELDDHGRVKRRAKRACTAWGTGEGSRCETRATRHEARARVVGARARGAGAFGSVPSGKDRCPEGIVIENSSCLYIATHYVSSHCTDAPCAVYSSLNKIIICNHPNFVWPWIPDIIIDHLDLKKSIAIERWQRKKREKRTNPVACLVGFFIYYYL
jgi:hypothetical protein